MKTNNIKYWNLNKNNALKLKNIKPKNPNPTDLPPPNINLKTKTLNIKHYNNSTYTILENKELKY